MGSVIQGKLFTEKAMMLEYLTDSETSKSLKKYNKKKIVFKVTASANKAEIRKEIEKQFGCKVDSINTILSKPKKKGRGRTRVKGRTAHSKKAIVTFKETPNLEIKE